MYSQTVLDDIRDRVSIAALIGERLPLKKAGRNFKGCCPFHSEKTASFMVSDEKRIYHCFGCGEGGNVFNFFMKFDGLSFREAVEMLAERAGVRLPKLTSFDKKKEDELTTRKTWAYRLNQVVTEYWANNLKDPKNGEAARNYLKSRDINLEKNTQLFLGYADDTWDGLVRQLMAKSVPLDLAVELGLLKRRDDGGYYDFFRHRIVFPVMSPSSKEPKIVAFSGRTFGEPKTSEGREAPAKYLNSPDSLIYHKSYTVYGLDQAFDTIRRTDLAVLVEGNLDVVRLHQEGLTNAVAPLGTALTSGHIRLISRYTKNFVVIFDGDEAGRRAAIRSLPVFLEEGLVPRVVALATGEDPDSFVRKNGAEKLTKLIESSKTLFEWMIDETVARFGGSADGKVKAVEELKPFFLMVKSPVEVSIYEKKLASKLMLDESVIAATFAGRRKVTYKKESPKGFKTNTAEKMLLELMLSYPETVTSVLKEISAEQFGDGSYQTIAALIMTDVKKNGALDVARLADGVADEGLKSEILALAMAENKYDEPAVAVKDCLAGLKRLAAKRRIEELSGEIGVSKDDEVIGRHMAEIQKITKELHNIES
ncbi:MAG: DNA primase [Deltaproteobacteria bacterium CG11_big_fil_rev_8_21_14_0_20_49_13]|nr:MAG: DNA primase [Deltaproteobacteria bacterium CG11_big_fil_rev_8_21_14_0_20_49_13]